MGKKKAKKKQVMADESETKKDPQVGEESAAENGSKPDVPPPAAFTLMPDKNGKDATAPEDAVDLSNKVKQMFIRKDSELVEPDAFAAAFHGSGAVNYTPDEAPPATPTAAAKDDAGNDADADPAALPSTPSPSFVHTDETRAASHAKLRAYEATRRASYATKLSSSGIYWQAVRDMCHDSIAETVRAEQVFKGCVHLNDVYATFLEASSDNMLNDAGLPVLDARRRKKLEESRSPAAKSPKKGDDHPDGADTETADNNEEAKADAPEKKEQSGTGGVLDSLFVSQRAMSAKFAEFSAFIEQDAVPEIAKIKESLVMQVEIFEKLGDAIVENMEAAEKEVADAWSECIAGG